MKNIHIIAGFAMMAFALIITPAAQADYLLDRSGSLVAVDGYILGDEDEQIEDTDQSQQELEQNRERAKKELERQIEKREQNADLVKRTSQVEIEQEDGKLKLKQETKDKYNKSVKKELELKAGESLHIENSEGKERFELRLKNTQMPQRSPRPNEIFETKEESSQQQRLEIIKNKIRTETKLPLSINSNNELIVTRPDGSTKVVTVLPDQAVENLSRRGIVLSDPDTAPELTQNEAGEPVYQLEQSEQKRILGIALNFRRRIEVSAETGEVQTTNLESNPLKKWLARFVY